MMLNDTIAITSDSSNKKLIKFGEKALKNNEKVLFSLITYAKVCESVNPKTFTWNGAKSAILIVTSERLIIGQKRVLSPHFEEVLPQQITSCYKRNLSDIQSLCIKTKLATIALQLTEQIIDKAYQSIKSIESVVSEYSSEVEGFPKLDKNNKRLLKIYNTIIAGVDRNYDGQNTQYHINNLKIGERVILIPDPNNKYDDCAVKVCNSAGIQLGWIPNDGDLDVLHLQSDIFNRLINGNTVLAEVKEKYINQNKKIGVIIDVARYATR